MTAYPKLAAAFAKQHPTRVAELVETSASDEVARFLETLPALVVASVLTRAAPTLAAEALANMQQQHAQACLRQLSPRVAAALLGRLGQDRQRLLLESLPNRDAQRIAQLLGYRDSQVASRVDPRAPAVGKHVTVAHALEVVRQARDGALHYIYVVDDAQKLVGVSSMREMLATDPKRHMMDIMIHTPQALLADDPLNAVVVHPGWRKVHALPVVDQQGVFIGVIRYSEFRALEAEAGLAQASGSRTRTTAALGELFWLGASAMMHIGEAAVLGRGHGEGGNS